MGGAIICVLYFVVIIVALVCAKWVLAVFSILSGDKEALRDCNLCEKDVYIPQKKGFYYKEPWRDYNGQWYNSDS